jgi:hypothetical protein
MRSNRYLRRESSPSVVKDHKLNKLQRKLCGNPGWFCSEPNMIKPAYKPNWGMSRRALPL